MNNRSKNATLRLQKKTFFERLEWFLNPLDAAQLCYKSPSTIYKWINGHPVDPASLELLHLKVFGTLPFDEWQGFRFHPDGLKTPCGRTLTPKDLIDTGFMNAVYRDTQKINEELLEEIRRLKADNATLKKAALYKEPTHPYHSMTL